VAYVDALFETGRRAGGNQANLSGEAVFATGIFNLFFPVLGGQVTGAQTIIVEKDPYQYQVTIEASGVIRGEML
jgi:hypothetical protein